MPVEHSPTSLSNVGENNPQTLVFGRLPEEVRRAKADRKIKKVRLTTEVSTLRRYIGRAKGDSELERRKSRKTRSTATKKRYILDTYCTRCAASYVELFEPEATHFLLNLPLECEHGFAVYDLETEPTDRRSIGPALLIPAIELAGALSTTGSQVGLEKLSRQMETVRQARLDLQSTQDELIRLNETDFEHFS